jgi:ketosteroid isomerase-like protein
MYHSIVARRTAKVFAALNRHDAAPLLDGMDPHAVHVMNGEHALAGARCRHESVSAWYQRLFRLLPDLTFDVDAIAVTGWPWSTTVFVQWRDRALDGSYTNQGVNVVTLRWGKVHSIRIHCDSQRMAVALAQRALAGVSEGAAAAITDPTPGAVWAPARTG